MEAQKALAEWIKAKWPHIPDAAQMSPRNVQTALESFWALEKPEATELFLLARMAELEAEQK